MVECEVPWVAGGIDGQEKLPLNLTAECLGSAADSDLAVASTFYEDEDMGYTADNDPEALFARQSLACQPRRSIKKKGDGSPHKWRRHRQLTDRVGCNGGECGMEHGPEVSVTHQATFSLSGMGSAEWISGGYSVSWTRGNSQVVTCGGDKNQIVCIGNWRRYQQYTVVKEEWNTCSPSKKKSKTYDKRSPLSGSGEHLFYCKRGGCQGKRHVTWEDRGKGKHGGA